MTATGKNNKSYKHGLTNHPLFRVWQHIKDRCINSNDKSYKNYGGRDIKICKEWLNDFKAFYDWCIVTGYKKGLTLDRIDNNGNYEPNNCRWASRKIQNRNKRSNTYLSINKEVLCFKDACDKYSSISYSSIISRICRGWNLQAAMFTPSMNEIKKGLFLPKKSLKVKIVNYNEVQKHYKKLAEAMK